MPSNVPDINTDGTATKKDLVVAVDRSFKNRDIKVIITLPDNINNSPNVFFNDSNVITIQNARVTAHVLLAGSASLPVTKVMIYGLDKSVMDKLTVYQWNLNKYTNAKIELYANDNLVCIGTFQDAYADYNSMPNVPFIITASYGVLDNLKNVTGISFGKAIKVTDIAQSICNLMDDKPTVINGLATIDNKGNPIPIPTVTDAVFSGSPIAMLWKLKTSANMDVTLDASNNEVLLTYKGDCAYFAVHKEIPLVTSETGLIGSPLRKSQILWTIKVLYSPVYKPHGLIRIQSKLVPNGGDFYATIQNMVISLDSQTPNGQWFIEMDVWLKDGYAQ